MTDITDTSRWKGEWRWRAMGVTPPAKKKIPPNIKASLQAALMVAAGWFMFHYFDHRVVPVVVWSFAVVVFVGGWFLPPVFKAIEVFGHRLGRVVSLILNWLLLCPFYYLCFIPGRIVLKWRGIDPMERKFPDDRPSFWIPRRPMTRPDQYRKQH